MFGDPHAHDNSNAYRDAYTLRPGGTGEASEGVDLPRANVKS